jgi:hypothetical protein
VTPTPDRDRAVEELLRARRARHAEPAPPSEAACPAASELAAWADGSLPAREAERLEAHLATCGHCEAVLAAFATATPPAPVPAWRRWAILVPFAAATAAAAVWLIVWPGRRVAVTPQSSVAVLDAPASRPAAGAPAPAPNTVAAPRAGEAAARPPRRGTSPVAAAPTGTPSGDFSTDQVLAPRAKVAQNQAALAAPRPQPPAVPTPTFRAAEPAPTPPPPPPAAPIQPARQADMRSATVVAESPLVDTKKSSVAEFASPALDSVTVVTGGADVSVAGASGAAMARGGGGGGRGVGASASSATPRPIGPTRWRILASGAVERLSADGPIWRPVVTDSTVQLTGGAAPSATTCWLVGKGGAVLVTHDAEHFVRVDIPEPRDLVSVTATMLAVTVTAADGSRFTTVDGGLTWKRPTP